jgi:hypothetical protein
MAANYLGDQQSVAAFGCGTTNLDNQLQPNQQISGTFQWM